MITIITNINKLKVNKMKLKLSTRSKDRLSGVNPKLLKVIDLALTFTSVDFGIPRDGGLRTEERQKDLFDLGFSKCDGVRNKSYHQSGNAFDVYAYVHGKASWNKAHLTAIAAAILQAANMLGYELEWGGLWDAWQDYPHFELKE